jgi:pimeloyl-ACP methyl ester carboxylesterase
VADNGGVTETMMPVNGIEICVETFGDPGDPALLLIAGRAGSMDSWDDEFCRRLAARDRFVIRYDHRDTGRSTGFPAGDPPYRVTDLAHDALGVLDSLGVHRAHLVGFAMGGELALHLALDRPHRVDSLTLVATAPAPAAPAAQPDWSHRRTAVDHLVRQAWAAGGPFTADEPHLRRLAERIFDRTRDMAAAQRNHALLDRMPRPSRLAAIDKPALVLHGTLEESGAARALADEIPGARLVRLEGVGHECPPAAVWSQVIGEIVALAGLRRQPA